MAVLPTDAFSADITIDANITFRKAVSATKNNDMNFGAIDYDTIHEGEIQLATNGTVQLSAGTTGLSIDGGTPSAGDIVVSGDTQSTIEISCESHGTLAANGNALSLNKVEFAIDTGTSFGSATACNGLSSSSAAIDLGATPAPKLLFGGAVKVATNAINAPATFSTTSTGGDPITVRVIYQ